MRGEARKKAFGALSLAAAATMVSGVASVTRAEIFTTDNYSANSTGDYTQVDETTTKSSWTVANGTLNYKQADTSWHTSLFLLNSSVASTAGLTQFGVAGDIIGNPAYTTGNYYQPGLILTGDQNKGGFVVAEYENGKYQYHFVLLQETGGQLAADEGGINGVNDPTPGPVVADFGAVNANGFKVNDNFHIDATVNRGGAHPVFTVSITDTTAGKSLVTNDVVTDTAVAPTYGGVEVGWRARYSGPDAFSVDNLVLTRDVVPEPASLAVFGLGALGLVCRRRR